MTDYAAIIEREFRRAKPDATNIIVTMILDDEAIEVIADEHTYRCAVGSDDDEFIFECEDADAVTFPFPNDWVNA